MKFMESNNYIATEMMGSAMTSHLDLSCNLLLAGLIIELEDDGWTEVSMKSMEQWLSGESTPEEIVNILRSDLKPYVEHDWFEDKSGMRYRVKVGPVLMMKPWDVETQGYRDE